MSERVLNHLSPHPGQYLPFLGHQVSTGLGVSSPMEVREDSLCYLCSGGHKPAHVCSLVGGLVSGSSEGFGLVDIVVLPMGLPSPFSPFSPSPNSFTGVPDLRPMVGWLGYKYLHRSQSAAGR